MHFLLFRIMEKVLVNESAVVKVSYILFSLWINSYLYFCPHSILELLISKSLFIETIRKEHVICSQQLRSLRFRPDGYLLTQILCLLGREGRRERQREMLSSVR